MQYIDRLIEARKNKKLTQQKVAEYLQISQQQYSDYERGKNELPIRYLIQICKLLEISADWALGLVDTPPNPR